MHTLSTDFNQAKLPSMFILTIFPLLQDRFHAEFRLLFPLFRSFRAPYSCPSIESNSAGDFPVFIIGFIHNLTVAKDHSPTD